MKIITCIAVYSFIFTGMITPALSSQDQTKIHHGSTPKDQQQWWKLLDNQQINTFIKTLLTNNHTIAITHSRLEQSKALEKVALSALMPKVSIESSFSATPYSTIASPYANNPAFQSSSDIDFNIRTSAMASAAIEIDLVGKNFSAFNARRFDSKAVWYDNCLSSQQIISQFITYYFQLIAHLQRYELAQTQLETNEKFLTVIEQRFSQGSASALDVLQQKQQIAANRSQLPLIRQNITITEKQLKILLGDEAIEIKPQKLMIPLHQDLISLALDKHNTQSNMNILSSQIRYRAAQSRYNNAVKTLLPSLTISGQAGYQGAYLASYNDELSWSTAASLSIPLWGGGALWANVSNVKQQKIQAFKQFELQQLSIDQIVKQNQQVLKDQLAYYHLLEEQRDAAQKASDEGINRYLQGIDTYINVLSALMTKYAVEATVVNAKQSIIAHISNALLSRGENWGVCNSKQGE